MSTTLKSLAADIARLEQLIKQRNEPPPVTLYIQYEGEDTPREVIEMQRQGRTVVILPAKTDDASTPPPIAGPVAVAPEPEPAAVDVLPDETPALPPVIVVPAEPTPEPPAIACPRQRWPGDDDGRHWQTRYRLKL
jgi:hypothetical protein